jgi:hypothetical protein
MRVTSAKVGLRVTSGTRDNTVRTLRYSEMEGTSATARVVLADNSLPSQDILVGTRGSSVAK